MRKPDAIDWQGYWPAVPTPFDESGVLMLDQLGGLIELYLGQGMHGLVINGTTGEWFSQSIEERATVAKAAVDAAATKVPVIIGCSGLHLSETVHLIEHAHSIGASGVLVSIPPYVVLDEVEAVDYYRVVGKETTLPIVAYNWPPGTGVDLSIDALVAIADCDGVVGIKESTVDHQKAMATAEQLGRDTVVFTDYICPEGVSLLRQNGGGYIGGGALLGRALPRFFELARGENPAEAVSLAMEIGVFNTSLTRSDWSGVFGPAQSQLKAAMRLLGQPGGYPRFPRRAISDAQTLERLDALLGPARKWQ